MDDIYNDLENFNDVNIVEELKHENKELKFKLEEYSSAMHKLQKDFDKLSVEYKNLEKNYSSLLKTARAEIERKTDTIKKLNLEKDTLVLNSLQKGKNILHTRRTNFKDTQQNKKPGEDTNSSLKEVKKLTKGSTECLDNKLPGNRQPSIETVSSIPTDSQSTHSENKISNIGLDNKIPKEGHFTGRDERDNIAYTKEHIQERPNVRKVMNRRKSMPGFGDGEPTFSSDEDSRKTNLEPLPRDTQLAGDVRHFERRYEKPDYIVPESFDYSQPPPSSYRNRGNRYNEFERQRNYEPFDKSRRYFSPDTQHHRYGKELLDNYNQRDIRDKRRIERSPPSDRYNRSKSRDRRHNFERENYHRYSNHNEHLPTKNKSKFELEEPSSKRSKIDSYNRHPSDQNFNKEKVRGLPDRHTFTKPKELLEPLSCPSPDYIVNSNELHHSVKELRPTAIPFPDTTNNKYISKSNIQEPILAIPAGDNGDMNDISTWVEDKQKSIDKPKPKAVDVMPETYVDRENFGKSPSLESGEIQSLDDDHYVNNEPNIDDQMKENVKSNDYRNNQIISPTSTNEVDKTPLNKYKIPRKKTKESSSQQQQHFPKKLHDFAKDFKVIVEGKHLSEKCSENNSNIVNENPIITKNPESALQKLMNESKCNENANTSKLRKSNKVVNISTIAGDLELSDETSDTVDFLKEEISPDKKKTDHLTKKEKHISSEKLKDQANKSDDKAKKSKESRKSSHSKKENVKDKTRDHSSSKKRKNKKQIDEEKISISKELSPPAKSSKEKGDKPSSVDQRKNKFTDLFGDSNSLITPDDLGLTNVASDKYVAVDENTQDAVDLNVKDIMVKARKSVENSNVDEKSNEQIPNDTSATGASFDNLNNIENERQSNKSKSPYENAITETNTSNIVKTIIISTGVQPQHILKDIDEVCSNEESDLKKNAINIVKAVATSTPYKVNYKGSPENIESTILKESINTTNNANQPDMSTDINLKTNTESNCESDIPDVRIFVRRRKKAVKKPT